MNHESTRLRPLPTSSATAVQQEGNLQTVDPFPVFRRRLTLMLLVRSTFTVIYQTAESRLRYFFHLLWKQTTMIPTLLQIWINYNLRRRRITCKKRERIAPSIMRLFLKIHFNFIQKRKFKRNLWKGLKRSYFCNAASFAHMKVS